MACQDDSSESADAELKDTRSTESRSILEMLRTESAYRKKIILTLAVCWSYVNLAAVVIQIGTALPSLQRLVDVDLETAAWLFTTWSLGFVPGALLCGYLYDKINRLVVMFFCTIGTAVCTACLPFCKSFPVMIIVRIFTGIFCGGIDTGANTIVPSIWGSEGGSFVQAMYLAYTVGGIIVPFATEPFMAIDRRDIGVAKDEINTSSAINYLDQTNSTVVKHSLDLQLSLNYTFDEKDAVIYANDIVLRPEEESIHYAFILTSVFSMTAAMFYLAMTICGGFDQKTVDSKNPSTLNIDKEQNEPLQSQSKTDTVVVIEMVDSKITGARKYLVLVCVAGINLLYGASEASLGDFMVTYCLDYMNWSTSSAVSLTSMYWVTSCLGGLSGIILVKWLRPAKLLLIAHLFWIATFLMSVFAGAYKIDILVWIVMPGSGFFMVLIIPAAMSWTEENVCNITGKISSLFMLGTGTGIAANPKFIGYFMEEYSYICLVYILFAESVICFGFYVMAQIVRNFRYTPEQNLKSVVKKYNV